VDGDQETLRVEDGTLIGQFLDRICFQLSLRRVHACNHESRLPDAFVFGQVVRLQTILHGGSVQIVLLSDDL
jgi:hypothetical protein